MNIAICGYDNVWMNYIRVLEEDDIKVSLLIISGYNNEEHIIENNREILNLNLLNKGIIPDNYKHRGLNHQELSIIYQHQVYFDLMFDRFELNVNKPKINSFDKNYIITNIIDYYIYRLEHLNLDYVVFADIPHNIFDFSFYIACTITSTKTLINRRAGFNTIEIRDSIFTTSNKLKKALKNREQEVVNYKEIELYIKKLQNNDYSKIQPKYMKEQEEEKKKGSFSYLIKKWFNTKPLYLYKYFFIKDKICSIKTTYKQKFLEENIKCTNVPYFIRISENFFFKKKLLKEYRKYSENFKEKDLKDINYIYLALHFQPEATSLPTGEFFTNQMNIIRLISSSIPENWKLIVREHPSQIMGPQEGSGGRWLSFYKYAKKFDNVSFASMDSNQIDLISHSKCIATISGTVGIEALARQKKVLIFGNAWYKDLKAVKRISTKNDIINFIKNLDWSYKNDKEMENEIYTVLSHNFKNILLDENSDIKIGKGYLESIIFYSKFLMKGKND